MRELECKLQLQTSSLSSSLAQLSERDSMCTAIGRDVSQLKVEIKRLDANGLHSTHCVKHFVQTDRLSSLWLHVSL